MISRTELRKIARGRLRDAEVLLHFRRYDGAVYLCGYAVECALKARICRTLRWPEFPSTRGEFQNLQTFKTHDLDLLLGLTGREARIKTRLLYEWSVIAQWDPEVRYKPMGSAKRVDAEMMISSAKSLLRQL
jgi:HEPN domain-containing protein